MQPIIEVKGLSKKYRLGETQPYYTLRDSVAGMFKNPFAKKDAGLEKGEFWALNDVNFTVMPGEVVGIIGRNGAGKSTLLKILSQITPPTEGEVIMRGRVGSLLEVGTGFSPELTGRENIYLNGAILGMRRAEVKKRFDEIVAFSEVEKFLDTPMKRYSSGMYMRLAFAVAAHLETEILIVDEVLAVGDAEFQKKALGKMGEVTKQGRTVLFVSHNFVTVQKLCKRSILLDLGKVISVGETNKVLSIYQKESYRSKNESPTIELASSKHDGLVHFTKLKIERLDGANAIRGYEGMRFLLSYASDVAGSDIINARIVITVISQRSQQIVLRLDTDVASTVIKEKIAKSGTICCETAPINLSEGKYTVNIDMIINGTSCDYTVNAAEFSVEQNHRKYGFIHQPDNTICDFVIRHNFKSFE
jgi:lipopolysaccharide transport system ATP-binding protein